MQFLKYQGTGNDFVLIEDHEMSLFPKQIKQLCNRRYGVGGDGLILVKRSFPLLPFPIDAEMKIFNADGGSAEMCGNGLRCVIRYLIDRGVKKTHFVIRVDQKYYRASIEGEEIIVDMGPVAILEENIILEGAQIYHINTGVPHLVYFCNLDDWNRFDDMAKVLRNHPHFSPAGVNVNFVLSASLPLLQVRTFERGVENETFSCGTGATAVCVAAWKKYGMKGRLEVEFTSKERLQFDLLASSDQLEGIYMRGDAMRVFEGEIEI